jgi:hypothetical protein
MAGPSRLAELMVKGATIIGLATNPAGPPISSAQIATEAANPPQAHTLVVGPQNINSGYDLLVKDEGWKPHEATIEVTDEDERGFSVDGVRYHIPKISYGKWREVTDQQAEYLKELMKNALVLKKRVDGLPLPAGSTVGLRLTKDEERLVSDEERGRKVVFGYAHKSPHDMNFFINVDTAALWGISMGEVDDADLQKNAKLVEMAQVALVAHELAHLGEVNEGDYIVNFHGDRPGLAQRGVYDERMKALGYPDVGWVALNNSFACGVNGELCKQLASVKSAVSETHANESGR